MKGKLSFELRAATDIDYKAIHKLLLESRQQIGLTMAFGQPEYLSWVADECNKGNVWVMFERDTGPIAAMMLDGDELSYLVVAAHHRGHGICAQLIEHAKTQKSTLTAEALTTNELMRRRFHALGFKSFDRKKTPSMTSFIWQKSI
jgi:GNAT superfamily N-acetyltransferase